jgi:hypothetical protein
MAYALRNDNGEIIALTISPNFEGDEYVSLNSEEVLAFMSRTLDDPNQMGKADKMLLEDFKQIRIVEDLIDLLTAKGIILFSELPGAAQKKILGKKLKREEIGQSNDILVDDVPVL